MLLHDVSQTALAAAVFTLGLVMLLEMRSFNRVRRSVDINLGRVFEQLEMLRAESRQMLEVQAKAQAALRSPPVVGPARPEPAEMLERPLVAAPTLERAAPERSAVEPTALDFVVAPPIDADAYLKATAMAARGLAPAEIAARCGLPAGEARLLASLATARTRREAPAKPPADTEEAAERVNSASATRS
jgi:hypothetical protein